MQETDFHEQAEDRFIAEVAGFLGDHSRINGNNVVVIAPPRTLGRLRQHYPNGTADRVIAEIPKDLTRSEEHTSELQSLMRISYAVFCLKKKTKEKHTNRHQSRTKEHKYMKSVSK